MDDATIAVYDARAQDYAAQFGSDQPGAALRTFMSLLPEGANVLDLGCGPGHSAAHMAGAGFRVTATDGSSEMVKIATGHAGVTALRATFDDLAEIGAYDGIWANFSLLHAPRDRMAAHLDAIARALRPGGVFHIGMKTGEGTDRDGIGRQYTFYTRDDLAARLAQAGFDLIGEETGRGVGLAGTEDPWIILRGRRHA